MKNIQENLEARLYANKKVTFTEYEERTIGINWMMGTEDKEFIPIEVERDVPDVHEALNAIHSVAEIFELNREPWARELLKRAYNFEGREYKEVRKVAGKSLRYSTFKRSYHENPDETILLTIMGLGILSSIVYFACHYFTG